MDTPKQLLHEDAVRMAARMKDSSLCGSLKLKKLKAMLQALEAAVGHALSE